MVRNVLGLLTPPVGLRGETALRRRHPNRRLRVESLETRALLAVVGITLETTDLAGVPISEVTEGEEFLLRAFVEDLREVPQGVFAAYMDVTYDSAAVSVDPFIVPPPAPQISFGSEFHSLQRGDGTTPGLIDEVGAVDGSSPLGAGQFLLFSIVFSADSVGTTSFATDPAEDLPFSSILVYGENPPVNPADVLYGGTSLEIVAAPVEDTTPPALIVPPDVALDAPADISPANTGFATATDNIDPNPLVAFADIIIPGPVPAEYIVLRMWTASDAAGNSTTGTQVISVLDTTPPIIVAPPDVTLTEPADVSPANTGFATASDAADPVLDISYVDVISPGTPPVAYTVLRTWSAVDDSDNVSSADQLITVVDGTPPETFVVSAVDGEGVIIADGGSTLSESMNFLFSSNETPVTFEYSLDNDAFMPANSSQEFLGLFEGSHVLEVRAIDAAGNIDPTPATFTWTVLTAEEAIGNLQQAVSNLNLPGATKGGKGIENSLLTKLDGALKKLSDGDPTNDQSAINQLNAFINHVHAQRGKKISTEDADALVAAANSIIEDIIEDLGPEVIDEQLLNLLVS